MSKMPAKKKSCFQITSVTQAQVAASSVADDTESLDDPDESRTEDVSSEIFDVTRADYETVCDRSSSEETLNNVGEQEAPGIMAPSHIPQAGQSSAMSGPSSLGFRKVGVAGSTTLSQQATGTSAVINMPLITQPGIVQQHPLPPASGGATNMSISTSQPAATSSTPSTTTSAASCSSRFRVIKLDHGTGEPFRRGRWTCMEFYEKDSEGSTVSRTVDSVRHGNAPDPDRDRDSGLGFTGGSVAAALATQLSQGSAADASLPASHAHSADMGQQQPSLHHQNYNVVPQAGGGMASQSTFSSSKSATVPAGQPVAGSVAPQNLLPVGGHNGQSPAGIHLQMSPGMLPPAGQAPALSYAPQQPILQQFPLGHPLANPSSGVSPHPGDFYQPAVMQPMASSSQTLPVASLSGGQPAGQGPSPGMVPAVVGASVLGQVGEMIGAGGGSLPVSQPATTLLQQTVGGLGGVGGSVPGAGSVVQQPMGQYAPGGPIGTQNAPAASVTSGAPAVPNLTSSSTSSASPPSGQRAQTPPDAGLGHSEGSGRKAEGGLAVQPAVTSGKDPVKPLIPESLHLSSPSVNSLFGIAIHMDGDEDSASGASVVAIDNKIEQAMDLVKSHLMYAVREEVEVLKEQIKELFERNSVLERENAVLKSLANSEQLSQLSVPPAAVSNGALPQQGLAQTQPQLQAPAAPFNQQLQNQQLQTQNQQLQNQQLQTQQLQNQQLQPQAQQLQNQQLQPQNQQLQAHLDTSQPPQQTQPNVTSA